MSNGLQNWFKHGNVPNSLGFEQYAYHAGDLDSQLTCGLPASLIIDQEESAVGECQCDGLLFAWAQSLCQVIGRGRDRWQGHNMNKACECVVER